MDGYGKRVLIIDDAHDIRYMTGMALADAGYNVYAASDGSDGIQAMKKRRYDVVLVDYSMPRVNGVQFIEISRVLWPDTPIILMSGDHRSTGRPHPVEGIYALIRKPFELSDLLTVIGQACKGLSDSLAVSARNLAPEARDFSSSRA